MRNCGRLELQQLGQLLHAVGFFCKQTDDLEPVGICQGLEENNKFFAHVVPPLGLTDPVIGVVTSFAKGLQLLQPDLFQQSKFILEIEVRVILHLYHFQDLKQKLIRAQLVPVLLQFLVWVTFGPQREPVPVQKTFQVYTAPKQHFAVGEIFYLVDA